MPIILVVVWALGLWFLGKALATKPQPKKPVWPDDIYGVPRRKDGRDYVGPSGVGFPTVKITQRRQE